MFNGGDDSLSVLGQCKNFTAHRQILRNLKNNKYYAVAALMGTQLHSASLRDRLYMIIQKLVVPSTSRHIFLSLSIDSILLTAYKPEATIIKATPIATTTAQHLPSGPKPSSPAPPRRSPPK